MWAKTTRDATTKIAHWFPSKHGGLNGIKEVERNLSKVDCVIEVHDARVPFSGRNTDLVRRLQHARPHILVLNKCDTISQDCYEEIRRKLAPLNVLFVSARFGNGVGSILPNAVQSIASFYQNNVEFSKPFHTVMVAGVPNVGKSSIINAIRSMYTGLKNAATKVGARPGVTRSVLQTIRVSESPKVYLVDTPGVLEIKPVSTEAALRLALCGSALDHIVGPQLLSAYLLYTLNAQKNYTYAPYMGLDGPTDDLRLLLQSSAIALKAYQKKRMHDGLEQKLNLEAASSYFIGGFRNGAFGQVLLDYD